MGHTMADFGLPEPADDSTEVAQERLRWDRRSCQDYVDAHLPLLTPDEQRPIYEEVVEAVRLRRSLLTGLATLNHKGGTTAHAIYKIPVTGSVDIPQCSVTARESTGRAPPCCCLTHLG